MSLKVPSAFFSCEFRMHILDSLWKQSILSILPTFPAGHVNRIGTILYKNIAETLLPISQPIIDINL